MEIENPLVSIIILTYNSAEFVKDALESVKYQTYSNIELIVSDDCSNDNTVEICREWMKINKEHFIRTELATVKKNTGISANCNRGLSIAEGKWIKALAGDDKLLPECVTDFLMYINNQRNKNISIVFSNFKLLVGDMIVNNHPRIDKYNYSQKYFFKTSRQQFLHLMTINFVPAPTNFISRELLIKYGGFDERFPMAEDFPLWLKLTFHGEKLYYLKKETMLYRVTSNSQTDVINEGFLPIYYESINSYFNLINICKYPFHYLDFKLRFYYRMKWVKKQKANKMPLIYLSPLTIYRFFENKISSALSYNK